MILTNPNSPEAIEILGELNSSLKKITGDPGTSSYNPEDFDEDRERFILLKEDNKTIACGGFRRIDSDTVEMKRVYSRKRGYGSSIVKKLEEDAKTLGYRKIILSTRRVNSIAVNFYIKLGYIEIESYGKYIGKEISICLGKTIG